MFPDKKNTLETGMVAEKKLLSRCMKASQKAKAEFTEFEKRDLKVREDLKHNKTKVKKLTAKVEDEKKKVCISVSLWHTELLVYILKT